MIILGKLRHFFPVDGSGISQYLSTGKCLLYKFSQLDLFNCAGLHTWFAGTQVLEQTRENRLLHKKAAALLLPIILY